MAEPARAEPLVTLSGVGLSLGGRVILDGVDLAVKPGRIVTLIGPNGAGKTTLIRLALGLLKPDRGTVRRRPNLRVGYLPQKLRVDPVLPLTVKRLMGLTARVGTADRRRALAEVGAAHLERAAVQDLSGGEMQRVMLARALLREPDLMVLDEPIQGVDVAGQLALYDLIGAIRDRHGCGILMVSHDLHMVMAATDDVLCINRHVCCHGHPEAVSQHPEYLALFGPRAAGSLAVYTHHHDHHHDLHGDVVDEHGLARNERAAP
ncbi:MAG: zinc ABC transporter ATP-binding protein ZnuC [Rhodobacterales bacterium]|nr:zinc ABC transporter ATP-binding protein ZnuC [Rhodobacterales bacterium]